jgi:hypothetical protein
MVVAQRVIVALGESKKRKTKECFVSVRSTIYVLLRFGLVLSWGATVLIKIS